jgi:hypothetical protein
VPTDPVRLDLYAQLLDAVAECQDQAYRIEFHPLDAVAECQDQAYRIEFHPVEVPADLRDDESPPILPDAVRALERVDGLMRRIELAAPESVVGLAAELSLESTQIIAHAVDRPRRARTTFGDSALRGALPRFPSSVRDDVRIHHLRSPDRDRRPLLSLTMWRLKRRIARELQDA